MHSCGGAGYINPDPHRPLSMRVPLPSDWHTRQQLSFKARTFRMVELLKNRTVPSNCSFSGSLLPSALCIQFSYPRFFFQPSAKD